MTMMLFRYSRIPAFLLMFFFFFAAGPAAAEQQGGTGDVSGSGGAEHADATLARLSDEQVRNLLLAELAKKSEPQGPDSRQQSGLSGAIVAWLHLFDEKDETLEVTRGQALMTAAASMPGYLRDVFLRFGTGSGFVSAVFRVMAIAAIFLGGVLAVLFFKALTPHFHDQAETREIPEMGGYLRFWAGVMRMLPGVADLAVFAVVVLTVFVLTPLKESGGSRYLFLAVLLAILVIRGGGLLSRLVCSPAVPALRLLAISDATAATAHRIFLFVLSYVIGSFAFAGLVTALGMPAEGVTVLVIVLGSLLLLVTAGILLAHRRVVADYILSAERVDTGGNWVVSQFARLWHFPALLYLLFVWAVFLNQQILGVRSEKQAFLLSLLVLPIFLILDRICFWLVETAVKTLKIYHGPERSGGEDDGGEASQEHKERLLIVRVFRGVRLTILLALLGWVLHLWGYTVPYISTVTKVIFRSLIIMSLALFTWRIISGYIERRLLEEEPEESVEEDQDSEWGGSVARGRAYTLLPMVRKFIGTILVIMVALTILSTIGIEIGPLLAGAGVVGLAIGFGAQKLVSDIFSGFFFLLDDAFRVGEYLEAGGVSGAVEGITLRNILLRHHRGMLQIVPYSELGPVTNYMRGGIVVKFNLEFPYDTDIDLVRRIIKKVGKAMLEDEEFGKDFIRPVKSQGVREITNSVMVIRVKFTAQPGTHFVIRREAYRRITEALAAKGIYYAHRKVIVELPQEIRDAEDAEGKRLAEAGAAAAQAAEAQDGSTNSSGG